MLVYGTIIPYGGAGTKFGYWFNDQRRTDTKAWQLHYESIEVHRSGWTILRIRFPDHLLCVTGDFNQSRDGRRWGKNKRQWYGPNKGRQLLTELWPNATSAVSQCESFECGLGVPKKGGFLCC